MSHRRALQFALVVCALGSLSVAAWDISAGGFYFTVLGLRVSSWDAYKPFRNAIVALVAAMWLYDYDAPPDAAIWHRLTRAAPVAAAAAAVICAVVAIRFGIHAAGGADGYGYVSQAHLWASRQLTMPNPLASVTAQIGPAVAPLGYTLAGDPAWLIPVYSPGLPLMMALAMIVAGPSGLYLVVPLLGAATVWLTYRLGCRCADPRTAMAAALLVAFSPIVIFQSIEPMSDVPVTAWWLAAWVLALSARRWAPLAAGLAVSAAVVTRPNLVPLTIVLAFVVARHTPAARRLALFAAGVVPGCLFVAEVNFLLHGSPVRSGYGPLVTLYAWDRFGENARRSLLWLIDLHTPAILLALAAPLVTRVKAARPMLAFTAVLACCYLFYFVFDGWPFLRFFLPAIPLLCLLACAVALAAIARLPLSLRGAAVVLICTLLPGWYVLKAREMTVFAVHRSEYRYVAVGDAIARTLEPNAVVLTVLHSGSVRMYGHRPTVRWDLVEPDNLDFSLKALREGGYLPYLLLDDAEESVFRERFEASHACGHLSPRPIVEYSDTTTTRLYAFTAPASQAG